jgi:hypothetical protein
VSTELPVKVPEVPLAVEVLELDVDVDVEPELGAGEALVPGVVGASAEACAWLEPLPVLVW